MQYVIANPPALGGSSRCSGLDLTSSRETPIVPILPPLATKCLLALIAGGGVAVGAAGGLSPIGEQISVSIRAGARCVLVVGEVGLTSES